MPWTTQLVVLVVLAAVGATPAPAVRTAGYSPTSKPFCLVDTHIPDAAYSVEDFVRTHNYSPPPGLRGGSPFQDVRHSLPALLRPYKEYDVSPPVPGTGRPASRIVLSDRVPYASWYTADHYDSFLMMFPPGCAVDPTRWLSSIPNGGGGR